MQAFILAGGFATRLWPLTEKRAKPLLPLAGKPLIDHLIDQLPADMPVTVSTNAAFAQSFELWKTQRADPRIAVLTEQSHKDTEKLGALGAVAQWITRQKISDDILLLTGDNYCGFAIQDVLQAYEPGTPIIAAHALPDIAKASAFGTIIPAADSKMSVTDTSLPNGERPSEGTIQAFEEKPTHPKSALVSTGVSIIPAKHLPLLVEYAKARPDNVGGVFEEFVRRGIGVQYRAFTEPWFDIGSFEAYLEATRTLVGDGVLTGLGAVCADTETEGSVVLGNHSTVRNSTLSNVILFEHCSVEDCVLTDCILDDHCTLQGIDLTRQMLREGTVLRQEV